MTDETLITVTNVRHTKFEENRVFKMTIAHILHNWWCEHCKLLISKLVVL